MVRLRVALYICLIATAGLTLVGGPYLMKLVREGSLAPIWILSAPILFGIFFLFFAMDEIFKTSKGNGAYKPMLAPLLFGVLLLAFLLPGRFREYEARKMPAVASYAFFKTLASSKDARVRALVMVATCALESPEEWMSLIRTGLADADPLVQDAARFAIRERAGMGIQDDTEPDENPDEDAVPKANLTNLLVTAKKSLP